MKEKIVTGTIWGEDMVNLNQGKRVPVKVSPYCVGKQASDPEFGGLVFIRPRTGEKPKSEQSDGQCEYCKGSKTMEFNDGTIGPCGFCADESR